MQSLPPTGPVLDFLAQTTLNLGLKQGAEILIRKFFQGSLQVDYIPLPPGLFQTSAGLWSREKRGARSRSAK